MLIHIHDCFLKLRKLLFECPSETSALKIRISDNCEDPVAWWLKPGNKAYGSSVLYHKLYYWCYLKGNRLEKQAPRTSPAQERQPQLDTSGFTAETPIPFLTNRTFDLVSQRASRVRKLPSEGGRTHLNILSTYLLPFSASSPPTLLLKDHEIRIN